MDTEIGNKFTDDICAMCKQKIINRTKQLSKFALLRPKKTAKSFSSILCKSCKKRMIERLKNESTKKDSI